MTHLSRRSLLALLGSTGLAPSFFTAHASELQDRKLIFVILRGAIDGLAALIPDDAELNALRTHTIPDRDQRLNLGNGFRLHPSLSALHGLYRNGEVGFVHAASTPYRDRSHFDGQDFLETLGRGSERDGWLNRAIQSVGGTGLAVGYDLPLALRGAGSATNWSPPVFTPASEALLNRLQALYDGEPTLAEPLAMARATGATEMSMTGRANGPAGQYAVASKALGELMSADGGPNIGMLSFDGWDTHANQANPMATRLSGLDTAINDLKLSLGEAWQNTALVMCSEFGRTARENGSRGTDHGTGGLVILAGGAINGGRVHGDWPGLRSRDLHENRDLAPANDIVSVLKGVLRDHLSISSSALRNFVFDDDSAVMSGLVK